MEPTERGSGRRAVGPTRFPITAALDAFEEWQRGPTPRRLTILRHALRGVVEAAGATGAFLEVDAEPLRPISIGVGSIRRRPAGGASPTPFELTADRGRVHLGRLWLDSAGPEAATAARALGRSLRASWSDEERRFSVERLRALDAATRAVASVLSVDRVLQVIADRVRELVRAEYAAIGTVDQEGEIDRFITSGMSRLERERIGSPPRGRGLLGILIREPHVIRVADIAADRRRHGFPPHHPAMSSFLGAPLLVKGRVAGNLYLTNKIGVDAFTDADQAIVETFALHAAIAIDNARLHEQIQRLAVVEERERIGKDLHDGIIQAIYAVGLSLEDVPDLMETHQGEAIVRVDRAIENLNLAIRDIRNFIFGLRPELLEQAGFHAGLAALADEFRLNTMVDVDLLLDGRAAIDLPEEETVQLLHITREALSNVARHSRATRATIELSAPDDTIRLVIADNGRGFPVGVARGPGHQGLVNMRGRAVGLGGRLDIESELGHGTRIIVSVPRLDGEAEGR
jgi:signal transduction histidine kinase